MTMPAHDPDNDWSNVDQWEAERLEGITERRRHKSSTNGNGPNAQGDDRYAVTTDAKGKLVLPESPTADDPLGCCVWLTAALNLDVAHPIIGGAREGQRGPDGHVVLRRLDAPPLRFEPASRLNRAASLMEHLSWQLQPSDGATLGYTNEHARRIADAVRYLCGASGAAEAEHETAGIVGAHLQGAIGVEGHTTHGNGAQRCEAARALQRDLDQTTGRPLGPPRYLVDAGTGEIVVRVVDLADTARRYVGGSLARGWLDGRMDGLGWQRVRLDGHALPGRAGRQGPHARCDVYRGVLPAAEAEADEQAVTT